MGKRAVRCAIASLALQGAGARTGPFCRRTAFSGRTVPSTLLLRRGGAFGRWPQFYTSFACFRKPNGNCLLGIFNPVLPFSHVMNFFADELSGLRGWRLTLASVFAGAFNSSLFGHIAPPHILPCVQSIEPIQANLSGKRCKTAKIFRLNSLGALLAIGSILAIHAGRGALTNLPQVRAI